MVTDMARSAQLVLAMFWYKHMSEKSATPPLICRPSFSIWQLRSRLRSYGAAGLLSYGLLNCIYYTVAFLAVYCWIGKAPAGELSARSAIIGMVTGHAFRKAYSDSIASQISSSSKAECYRLLESTSSMQVRAGVLLLSRWEKFLP